MMRKTYLALRSVSDRVFAGLLLVLLSPVLLAVVLAVRIKMGSPVLFRQTRVGRCGRRFQIFKFRTMVADAETLGGGYMLPELDLIPPLGRFLRQTSLDEIPQLLNILAGDMSFVGPRPALEEQCARYSTRQARRLEVPQGITGLAQIRFRNAAPWSRRIEADIEYVEHVSLTLDLRILFATIGRVARSEGIVLDQTREDVDDLGDNGKDGATE